jgi:HSP20 family protein
MFMIPFRRHAAEYRPRIAWSVFDGALEPAAEYVPALDVQETAEGFTVRADLPGLDKKDIRVSLEEGVLSVSGTRKAEHEEGPAGSTWHRVERAWGSFERSLRLGETADPGKVSAEYKDGVLSVSVAKKAVASPLLVEVR